MKANNSEELEDSMLPQYDFSSAARGKYTDRFPEDVVMVVLAPDVAKVFPDSESVNEALRLLMKTAQQAAGKTLSAA